ncbi:TPM domain-containing protein [Roseateles amylovorans]|uniref:TPM domain-containing protein n=1 Tax=Roseateles amylovorans TaxID=2978473 RepID=A0ABY6B0A5_9BURK|nr:TPM domain-containing protein [Roseateles amylovorans]UXH78824.1 TPM domain-containing protein [Roseateles amylovorans]
MSPSTPTGTPSAPPKVGKWRRFLRHRLWDEADAKRVLPADALARLSARVTESERSHTGEIRICVEASLPLSYLWRHASARERAVAMFGKLRVWDTEHNNGVLIYLLLAEHAIEIVVDRGLNRRVSAAQWRAIIDGLGEPLRQGRFEDGLQEAIRAVEALLASHFPPTPDMPPRNELPDAVLVI